MKFTNLGRTGLKVSRLCLGTMNFGPHTPEKESHLIMDRALDSGINFIDTANVYGWKKGEGITENIIGNWFEKSKTRDRVVLATKVYGEMGDHVNQRGLSAYHIRKACEESLLRLKTDHIDLYQMHHIHRSTPWEEIWQAMEQLVKEGKVLYIGSSNFAAIDIIQAQYEAKNRHFMGLVSEQSLYNLRVRTIELEMIPALERMGLGLIPWSPLGSGLLGGGLGSNDSVRRKEPFIKKAMQKHGDQVKEYEALCKNIGSAPVNVALAWLLSNPVVTAPIIGPRTMDQFVQSLECIDLELDENTLGKLDKIWPGPGGQAPEAYAW